MSPEHESFEAQRKRVMERTQAIAAAKAAERSSQSETLAPTPPPRQYTPEMAGEDNPSVLAQQYFDTVRHPLPQDREGLLKLEPAILTQAYKDKVGVPLKVGRHVKKDGSLDKEGVVGAILNPQEERGTLLAAEQAGDAELRQKGWQLT